MLEPLKGPGDEKVWNEPGAVYLLYGGDTTSIAQPNVSEHHIGLASNGGSYRTSFGNLDCANVVAAACEHIRKRAEIKSLSSTTKTQGTFIEWFAGCAFRSIADTKTV